MGVGWCAVLETVGIHRVNYIVGICTYHWVLGVFKYGKQNSNRNIIWLKVEFNNVHESDLILPDEGIV